MTEKELQTQQKREVQQNAEPTKPMKQFIPTVDIYEDENSVTLLAEMPGVSKNGVEIKLDDGNLFIEGVMQSDQEMAGKTVLLQEYEVGNFIRKFSVSETIDQDKIEAVMANGILKLVLPKIKPAEPKKIEIKAG
ncbi:MAG: Hsp20/alpha crystallin family protein [Desulfobulbaceae bacterium]|nr:Hsp20/alpha crystallin family protein [Desulfobulbaceae bacterium]